MAELWSAMAYVGTAYALYAVGAYLYNLLSAPKRLHQEQLHLIARLEHDLEEAKRLANEGIRLELVSAVFGETGGPTTASIVALYVKISNTGPPTTTADWTLAFSRPNDRVPTKLRLGYGNQVMNGVRGPDGRVLRLPTARAIYELTATNPVVTGGTEVGHLSAVVPGVGRDDLAKATFTVSCVDVFGQRHKVSRMFSGPPSNYLYVPGAH